jgi:hypothetical protein
MTLALVASVIMALIVFAFVLEPILRARGDRVTVDQVALPLAADEHFDPDASEHAEPLLPGEPPAPDQDRLAARATLDRPVSSDVT